MNYIIDVKRTEQGSIEPVILAEAKTQLRVTFTDDDTEITDMIARARRHIEDYCNISIVNYSISLIAHLDCPWTLPYGPVIAITGVSTPLGTTGSGPVSYENATTNWNIDGDLFGPAGCYKYRISYNTGMATVSAALKAAILCQVSYLYENRGKDKAQFATSENGICPEAITLANPYRVLWI